MLSTLALYPSAAVRSRPENRSLMMVTLTAPSEAAPIPCTKRSARSDAKLSHQKHIVPAIPKSTSEGTRTRFRPYRSARNPNTGVRKTPGRVNTEMMRPISRSAIESAFAIAGMAGVMFETPITTMRVTQKTIWRLASK